MAAQKIIKQRSALSRLLCVALLCLASVSGEIHAHMFKNSLSLDMGLRDAPGEGSKLWTAMEGRWKPGQAGHLEFVGKFAYTSLLSTQRSFSGNASARYHFFVNADVSIFPLFVFESEKLGTRMNWVGAGAGTSIQVEAFELELLTWVSGNTQSEQRLFSFEARIALPLNSAPEEKDLFGISGNFHEYELSSSSVGTLAIFFAQRF